MNWPRILAYGLVLTLCAGILELDGYRRGERKLWEYQAAQAKAAVPVVVKQGATTERVVTKYVKGAGETKLVTLVIEKEIVRYVPPSADPVLPRGWVLLHDAAAVGAVPDPADRADVAAPGVAASQAIKDVSGNYGACHETALQLAALQAWVRDQYEVMNQRALGY